MENQNPKTLEVPLTALKDGETGILTSIKVGHGRGR